MSKSKLDQKRALPWRVLATIVLMALVAAVLARHWQTVSDSLHVARRARASWLIGSLSLMAATFCIAAAIYDTLALRRLRYAQTLLVEVAAAFVGRLLPAGLGGLGLNGVYLYRRGHTPAEATAVVSVNNLLGMCAHLLLLAGVFVLRPHIVQTLFARHHWGLSWPIIAVVGVLLLVAGVVPTIRARLLRFSTNLLVSVRKEGPGKLLRALLFSALLTTTYTSVLFCAAHSIGIGLGMSQLFIVFSFGMFAATVTPTPGGLVGAEAGLFAGFVVYDVSVAQAGAAVLLVRLVTYWLPLIPGSFALLAARSRRLV